MSKQRLSTAQRAAHREASNAFVRRELAAWPIFGQVFEAAELARSNVRVEIAEGVTTTRGTDQSKGVQAVTDGALLEIAVGRQFTILEEQIHLAPEVALDGQDVLITKAESIRYSLVLTGGSEDTFLRPLISQLTMGGTTYSPRYRSPRFGPATLPYAEAQQVLCFEYLGMAAAELSIQVDPALLASPET